MSYSQSEVIQYAAEEDVKFIRLAFCDIYGTQKNISIMPSELERAFDSGIAFDGSAIAGFCGVGDSDLFLRPDPATLAVLPWRPEHGRVVRMFCDVIKPDGGAFPLDMRALLRDTAADAEKRGYSFGFGAEFEFYLFRTDENGLPTHIPFDNAGYMDIAPEDKGENVRREICLALEQMGIIPESSHHEEGPGQNEIDFRYSAPLTAADNAVTFKSVVRTISARSGLVAGFTPKPLSDMPGNGLHINVSAKASSGIDPMPGVIAGIIEHISECTAFLNPTPESYMRLGAMKAPDTIGWSHGNRGTLIRIPAASGEYRRAELRSPDPEANPYIALNLIIHAALDGITRHLTPPDMTGAPKYLPRELGEAVEAARTSEFIRSVFPEQLIDVFFGS